MCIPVIRQQVGFMLLRMWSWQCKLNTLKMRNTEVTGKPKMSHFLIILLFFLVFLWFRLTFSQRKLSPFAYTLFSFERLRIHKSSDTNCRYDLVLIGYKWCYWIRSQTNPQFESRNITAFTCSRSQFCRLSTRSNNRSLTQTLCINSNESQLQCCPPPPAYCIFIMRVT